MLGVEHRHSDEKNKEDECLQHEKNSVSITCKATINPFPLICT